MLALAVSALADELPGLVGELAPLGGALAFFYAVMKLITAVYREMSGRDQENLKTCTGALTGIVKSVDAYADEAKDHRENVDHRLDSIDRALLDIRDSLRRGG